MLNINLEDLGVDYFLVNSTNKFLLEYVPISENSCFALTGFTGEVGDVLLTCEGKSFLFVDSRFHIQADKEVNKSNVQVVKLALGQKRDDEICLKIKPNSVLGVNPEKISQNRYEYLRSLLEVINVKIKFIDIESKTRKGSFEYIPTKFTGASFEEKLKKIGNNILITKSEEIAYICNIRSFSFDFSVKIDGKLLILDNKPILFTDYQGVGSRPLSEFEDYITKIDTPIRVDKSSINAKDYSLLKNPINIDSPTRNLMAIKNAAELNHMEYCFNMTDNALKDTRDWIYSTDGITEYDISLKLEENFKKYGAKSLSFNSIVAINENSALAHYNKLDKTKILSNGDLVLIDCGAYYDGGLATDITRVFVKGQASELQKKVYTMVLKVFLNCFNYQLTPETQGFEIDKLAHHIFDANVIAGFEFSHGLGHGIGIGVHEFPPNLSQNNIAKTFLEENMCFTIEPGLYNADKFGIRLENTCYLKNGEICSFANMPFEKKLIDTNLLTNVELDILEKFEVM